MQTHDEKINRHIEDAERWAEKIPLDENPIDMYGWRPTSIVLAREVQRLREIINNTTREPLHGQKLLEAMQKFSEEVSLSKESALEFMVSSGIVTPEGKLTEHYREEE